MKITLGQLAALVRGKVVGDGELVIHSARTLDEAETGDITFVEKNTKAPLLEQSRASAAVVPFEMATSSKAWIQVADPLAAFSTIFRHMQSKPDLGLTGVDPRAIVDESACIGDDASISAGVSIGANCVIGKRCRLLPGVVLGSNCRLGDDVVLHPNVVLYDDTILGDRVVIHANAVIGADGFGYRFQQGRHVKVPPLGNVIVGDDVEIGACTCIDRGVFSATTIGDGTKIDNLVQIAHNCKIGKHNAFASQVGIAGSTTTGNYVVMGGQSGIRDHITVGDGAMIGAKAGVVHDVRAGARMFLYPAQEEREAGRLVACMKRLSGMRKTLLRVLKELNMTEESDDPPENSRKAS